MLLLDWTFMWKRVFWKIPVCLHFLIFYGYSKFWSFLVSPKWKFEFFSTLYDVSWTNEQNKTKNSEGQSFVYSPGAKNRSESQNWAGWAKLRKKRSNMLGLDIWTDLMLKLIRSNQQIQRYKQLHFSHQQNWDQKLSLIKTKLWPLLSPWAANLFDTHICILSSK